jgi:hypothetical protein
VFISSKFKVLQSFFYGPPDSGCRRIQWAAGFMLDSVKKYSVASGFNNTDSQFQGKAKPKIRPLFKTRYCTLKT